MTHEKLIVLVLVLAMPFWFIPDSSTNAIMAVNTVALLLALLVFGHKKLKA